MNTKFLLYSFKIISSTLIVSSIILSSVFAQSNITGTLKGLASEDSAIVRIQKSGESFFFKKLVGTTPVSDIPFEFKDISNGKWSISVDAKGYLFPVAKVIELNNNTIDNVITLTKAPSDSNFSYQWQDDSSYVGHAQQAYINDKVEINILGKAEKVPDDFNAINLLNEYGFYLSDSISLWTSEDAYRLYQTVKKFNFQKFGERDSVRVKVVWQITDSYIDKDIDFSMRNDIVFIRISRAAFTYASPLVVTVDGVKGKFFSKRLFNALVYYYTDRGTLSHKIEEIATTRYGIEFLTPSSFLQTLMGETETNFQSFTSEEKLIILSMFEEYPDAMQRQDQLKYMVRRVNGQKHPVYPDAPAIAWVTNQNIEWMEGAFKEASIEYMQRLVLHEKAHFLWEYTFDSTTKKDWAEMGGWFMDPSSGSGWSTSNTTEFVSPYAHLKNPNEDMAESIAYFITNPEALRSRSLKKFEFIRDRIMKGTRYISVIRPDLTFTVYNLFPDYNYPGKIKRTKLEVFGKENEDKKVVLEIELTIINKEFDGADWASCRFTSSIGTIKDMGLFPINPEKSILRGEMSLSKLAKSGYWIVPQIVIGDRQGNLRLENNTTYGLKCFVNNPLEDVTPPLYIQNSLKLDSVQAKMIDFTGSLAVDRCGSCADTLTPINTIKVSFDLIEKNQINPDGRALATIYLPTFDSTNSYNIQPYSFEVQISGSGIKNDFVDSIKRPEFYFPIPDYYPSGYYSISAITMADQALNYRQVLFDKDTANDNYFIAPKFINQRSLRDSIYFKTKYPDMKPPVLDLNDIQIQATPTNPTSPNGETLFEMWLWIKDESDFPGKASGFTHGSYTLRDPQGLEHNYSMQRDLGNLYYEVIPDSSIYGFKRYYFKTLLPVGSPPGLWGVSSITLFDKSRNRKYYNFVEIVRFDVEESQALQVTPYVEILGKKVNMYNVDSASVAIGCKSCKDQNYRLRMYSSMGGTSVVYEGIMTSDTIKISNLKLSGVNDGILYATVFILDSSKALIGTGRTTYTKDTKIPTSQKLQTNLSNFGTSNLDSLIINIESAELNGSYKLVLYQETVNQSKVNSIVNNIDDIKLQMNTVTKLFGQGDSLILMGNYIDGNFNIDGASIRNMLDGIIKIKFYLYDSVGNEGSLIEKNIYKDTKNPEIALSKSSLNGLKLLYELTVNEYISNKLIKESLLIGNGSIDSLSQMSNKKYNLYITKLCNDTTSVTLKAGALLDTVGNKNSETSFKFIDSIIPAQPLVSNYSVCQGNTSLQLSATPAEQSILSWYTTISGGTASPTAPTPSTSTAGSTDYYVSQTSTVTSCESPIIVVTVKIVDIPPKPTITLDAERNLISSELSGNQWYSDLTAITNATSNIFKPTASGNYSVKIVNEGCEGPISETYNYLITSIENFEDGEYIKLYPIPTNGVLTFDYYIRNTNKLNIDLYGINGTKIYQMKNIRSGEKIHLSTLPKATYIIKINDSKGKLRSIKSVIFQ